MNPWAAFVLGLLVGWLAEWVIDWVYWRRRGEVRQVSADADAACRSRVTELEQEVASYRSQLAALQSEHAQMEAERAAAEQAAVRSGPVLEAAPVSAAAPRRDRLEDIKDVSPELATCLYDAGVFTFADLGKLTPIRLREIAAGQLTRPGSEVGIVQQARIAAGMIQKVDDLVVIDGIGPVIARMLNEAGIFTFAELASLSETDLRAIVGERIQRLANEEKILRQAKELAGRQS